MLESKREVCDMQTITPGAPVVDPIESPAAEANFNLAMEQLHRLQHRGALESIRAALRLAPDNARYRSFHGLCLAYAGRIDEGVEECGRAIALRPEDAVLRLNLGRVHKLRGDKSTAHRVFLEAWQADKQHPGPAAELARMGVRRPPVLRFLPRAHWCNVSLGRLRYRMERWLGNAPRY
jgi:Flp pilus assembly protein TadD